MNLDTELLEITKENLSEAQFMAGNFINKEIKNRIFFNVISAEAVIYYLEKLGIDTSNLSNIHSIKRIMERIDIADIILPNIHIDVRVAFDDSGVFIPKSHSALSIVPDIYAVLNYDNNFEKINFVGYFEPQEVTMHSANANYYFVEAAQYKSPFEMIDFINNFSRKTDKSLSEQEILRGRELSISAADHDVSESEFKEFIQLLAKSKILRDSVLEYDNFETLAANVAIALRISKSKNSSNSVNEVVDLNDFIELDTPTTENSESTAGNIENNENQAEDYNGDDLLDETTNISANIAEAVGDAAQIAFAPTEASALELGAASEQVVDSLADAAEAIDNITSEEEQDVAEKQIVNEEELNIIDVDMNNSLEQEDLLADNSSDNESAGMEENLLLDDKLLEMENFEQNNEETITLNDSDTQDNADNDLINSDSLQASDLTSNYEILEASDADVQISEDSSIDNEVSSENIFDEFDIDDADFDADMEKMDDFIADKVENNEIEPEISEPPIDVVEKEDTEAAEQEEIFSSVSDENIASDEYDTDDAMINGIENISETEEDKNQIIAIPADNSDSEEIFAEGEELIGLEDISDIEESYNNDDKSEENLNSNIENNGEMTNLTEISDLDSISEFNTNMESSTIVPPENIVSEHNNDETHDFSDLPQEVFKENPENSADEYELVNLEDLSDASGNDSFSNNVEINFGEIEDISKDNTNKAESSSEDIYTGDDFSIEDFAIDNNLLMNTITENSIVISDKTHTPGEIIIDINKDKSNPDISIENEHLEELYNNENIINNDAGLNNDVRVVNNQGKSIPIAIGIGGLAIFIIIAGIIIFSVSKFMNPTQNNENLAGGNAQNNTFGNDVPNMDMGGNVAMNNNPNNGFAPANNNIAQNPKAVSAQQKRQTTGNTIPDTAFISVKKLSWEVPDYVSYDANFKQYFQSAGKSLKAALSSDLLLATDYTYSDQVRVSITFDRYGTFQQSRVLLSSGSSQVDDIVLQSVNQTLKVLKAPNSVGNDQSTTVILKIYL